MCLSQSELIHPLCRARGPWYWPIPESCQLSNPLVIGLSWGSLVGEAGERRNRERRRVGWAVRLDPLEPAGRATPTRPAQPVGAGLAPPPAPRRPLRGAGGRPIRGEAGRRPARPHPESPIGVPKGRGSAPADGRQPGPTRLPPHTPGHPYGEPQERPRRRSGTPAARARRTRKAGRTPQPAGRGLGTQN
jgi:hypothetical protein